eukprot:scaffold6138_cov105-Isochrysis_galbana.AAC.1
MAIGNTRRASPLQTVFYRRPTAGQQRLRPQGARGTGVVEALRGVGNGGVRGTGAAGSSRGVEDTRGVEGVWGAGDTGGVGSSGGTHRDAPAVGEARVGESMGEWGEAGEALAGGSLVEWRLATWRAMDLAAEIVGAPNRAKVDGEGARPGGGWVAADGGGRAATGGESGPAAQLAVVGPTMRWLERACLDSPDCLGVSVGGVAGGAASRRRRGASPDPPAVFWWRRAGAYVPGGYSTAGMDGPVATAAQNRPRGVQGAADGQAGLGNATGVVRAQSGPGWARLLVAWAACAAVAAAVCRLWRLREIAAGRCLRVARPKRRMSRSASAVSLGRVEMGGRDVDYHSE